MPISVPNQRVYYYDPLEDEEVLLCWIPPEDLKSMVEDPERNVDKAILRDYPAGLDMRVTRDDYEYFRKTYGLETGVSAEKTVLAFEACQESTQVETDLDLGASIIDKCAQSMEGDGPEEAEAVDSLPRARDHLSKHPAVQTSVDRWLDEVRPKRLRDESGAKAWRMEDLEKIRMTIGENPGDVFMRLQQRSLRR